ncbi:MAG: DUF3575 domain-containing protein [Prevotella sp.]|nr:DUF3575 domain-containing protein [Prevotella sp.]
MKTINRHIHSMPCYITIVMLALLLCTPGTTRAADSQQADSQQDSLQADSQQNGQQDSQQDGQQPVLWQPSRFALRTNLVWAATLTPNLGFDYDLGNRWSLGMNAGLNAWSLANDKKWKHVLVAAELRHWNKRHGKNRDYEYGESHEFDDLDYKIYNGAYWGVNVFYSHFNVGNVTFPFGMYKAVHDERRQGDLAGAGLFYGYSWRLSRLFRLEAEGGIGAGYAWYDQFNCGHCGTRIGKDSKPFLLPKLALNIVLDPLKRLPMPVVLPPVEPVMPVLTVSPVKPETTADMLMPDNPVLRSMADYRPYDRTRIMRRDSGALYVHFPLDKADLRRDFRLNAETLDRIVSITRQITADAKSNVRLIQIIGFASIEGRQDRNERLAQNRAEALKRYIQQEVSVPDSIFELNNGGEAWAEFRDQLQEILDGKGHADMTESTEKGLRQALDIIDSEATPDQREQRLRRLNGGRTWQFLHQHIMADQRNSGYLRVYFERVPDREAETINQAASLIQQQRYYEALALLDGVSSDPRSWNALATSLYMTGRQHEALTYFRKAAQNGNADAQRNLKEIERLKN